ncbi:MAG: extracellular solute-binding protein [Elusimicrobiota bacterium]
MNIPGQIKISKRSIIFFCLAACLAIPLCAADVKNRELVVWAMGYEGTQISKMARIFEKQNPGVEVITQAIPWGAAHEKLLTSIVGGVPPDISQMGTTWIPEFQSMDAFEPLDDHIAGSDLRKEDFFESSYGIGKINGSLYGIPWYVETRVLFYRTDILEKAGYDSPPETWEEFYNICTALVEDTDGNGEIDRYGISLPVKDEQSFLPVLWQNGGSILDDRLDKITVTGEEFAGAAAFYKKFFDNKAAPTSTGLGVLWAFKEGIYPMFISGPWMVNIIKKEAPEIAGKWNVALLPGKKNRNSFVGGCHMVIFKDSKNKELAWKFIEFMSDPDNQIKWFELAGGLPSNLRSWQSGYFDSKPMIKVFGEQMMHTKSPPNIPQWEEIASVIKQRIEEYILGQIPVSRMQQLLKDDIEKILTVTEKGSRNVVPWFIIVSLCGITLFLMYANYTLKSKKNIAVVQQDKIRLDMAPPGGVPGRGRQRYYIPYLFILPSIITLLVFLYFPIFSSFLISLTNWNIYSFSNIENLRFIGLDNYFLLFRDKIFWQALLNTTVFSGVGIPLNIGLALFLAVIIDKRYIQNKAIFRAGYFMPVVTTLVAVAVVWKWLYNPEYGLINYLIGFIGIEKQQWLSSPTLALPSLIVMSVWKNFGYNMVIILAGLQTIPSSLYEAASVDGADAWQSFWHITLPSLKPTLFFVMIMTTIGSLQFFAEPYIMTDGGPLNKTISIVMHMYNQGFMFFKFGYGTAVAYVLFVCILLFTVIQILYSRKLEAK